VSAGAGPPSVGSGRAAATGAGVPSLARASAPGRGRRARRRLSIGLYTYSTLPRGSVVHTAHLADALADAGHDVTVYALDKEGRGFFRPLRAALRLIPGAPAPATTAELVALRAAEMASYLAAHRPTHDVHHAEDCLTASGLLAARAAGATLRIVRTIHHVERFEDPILLRCQDRSIRGADLRLTVSEAARADVARWFGVDAAVVGNGVDAARFRAVDPERAAAWRARLHGGGPVVLAVGGVEERKNSLRLLAAYAGLAASHPGARLAILGGATVLDHGDFRGAFERAREALRPAVRAGVVELGVLAEDDVPALYQVADVVALPSLHEGFGLAALEALAAGRPLVASRRPPLTEFLDASCAVFCDPLSELSIGGALAAALDASASVTTARREAGRRRADAHGWPRVAARHVAAYERMIHARDALSRPVA
jgi:glycosyltransferase-like protein